MHQKYTPKMLNQCNGWTDAQTQTISKSSAIHLRWQRGTETEFDKAKSCTKPVHI
jgi:hypothetical protein